MENDTDIFIITKQVSSEVKPRSWHGQEVGGRCPPICFFHDSSAVSFWEQSTGCSPCLKRNWRYCWP